MRVIALARVVASVVLLTLIAACDADDGQRDGCSPVIAPGVVVYNGGIDLTIRDSYGRGEALGTTVTVKRGTDSIQTIGRDTLHVNAGLARSGFFSVRVSRPFYRDTVLPNVEVLSGECNILVTRLPVTLTLAPGAPAIRSVAIFADGLYLVLPSDHLQMVASVDADPAVDTRVTWSLSDTTLARIDDTGRVQAKCSLTGGADTVRVVMVADTTVRAKQVFGVQRQASCP